MVALVDDDDFEELNQWKWSVVKSGDNYYAMRSKYLGKVDGKMKFLHFSMHRVITNAKKCEQIDHINGNGLDNRKNNLRACTQSENQRNRSHTKNNTTGYKGVHPNRERFRASIQVNKKDIHIGYYKTPIEAATAYNNAALKYHGEFARLNVI